MFMDNSYWPDRRSIAKHFPNSGYCIFFDVSLSDLDVPSGVDLEEFFADGRTAEQLHFSVVICQGENVLAAAEPYWLRENLAVKHITGAAFRGLALCTGGLPMALWMPEKDDKALAKELSRIMKQDSGWTYRFHHLIWKEESALLARKLLEEKDSAQNGYINHHMPSAYGHLRGITEGCYIPHEEEDPFDDGISALLGCSERTWEALRNRFGTYGMPLWERVPLDTRVERVSDNRPCNPGHSVAVFQRIADIPLSAYFSHVKALMEKSGKEFNEGDNLREEFRDLSSVTYRQAAQRINRLLKHPKTRALGEDLLWELSAPLYIEHASKMKKKR